ncbi:unnamed protein product, partial [Didymodactylos carnosus]
VNGSQSGTPVKALFKDNDGEAVDEQHYWEFKFDKVDSAFIGVTTESKFVPGYGLTGLTYGGPGNLSDGSSGLAFGFDPKIKDGDKVGLLLDLNNNDLKLHMFHNDQPVGTAFYLQGSYPTPLYPIVHFDGDGEMTIGI